MTNLAKMGLRLAGLMALALTIAHCGDSDVRITPGPGVDPDPGTFTGTTDDGGSIVIQVASIDSIRFDCRDEVIQETFSPPQQIDSNGEFNVKFSDGGRQFRVSGQFRTNDTVTGTIDDEDNRCDTDFDGTRRGVPVRTATPGPGASQTTTPGGPTVTPSGGGTEPTPTSTPGGGVTATQTPTTTESPCPNQIEVTGDAAAPETVLDTGWTGIAHDSEIISEGKLTVNVSCSATKAPCGQCNVSGPVPNRDAGQGGIANQRCTLDTSIKCTSNAECSGKGTCTFFFGSLLPLSAGGVSTCVANEVVGSISGTANIEQGSGASNATLNSRVFLGITNDAPCPQCQNDPTPNDGNAQGTCSGGAKSGQACDANGVSPILSFGATSLDCPFGGNPIANLPIKLNLTTGTSQFTLSDANPNCRAITGGKCFCDTCATAAAEPCGTNADCPGGAICGGRRCVGGTNNGAACTMTGDPVCTGTNAFCQVPGTTTKANNCTDGNEDCSASGECQSGPLIQNCQIDKWNGCTSNAECTRPGDTCVGKLNPCFPDKGQIGGTLVATGQPDPPVNNVGNPILGAVFCIAPTGSTSVNNAAGLPGPARLRLKTTARNLFAQ